MAELSAKQLQAVSLLASGESITAVAENCSITRQAIHTWLKDNDGFLAYLNALKSENVTAARTAIQAAASQAVAAMVEIMKSSSNDAARLAAAKEILAMAGLTEATRGIASKDIGEVTADKVKAKKEKDRQWDELYG